MTVTGAGWAALHPGVPMQPGFGAGVVHSFSPVAIRNATSPPPTSGLPPVKSEMPMYATPWSSVAPPHIVPLHTASGNSAVPENLPLMVGVEAIHHSRLVACHEYPVAPVEG